MGGKMRFVFDQGTDKFMGHAVALARSMRRAGRNALVMPLGDGDAQLTVRTGQDEATDLGIIKAARWVKEFSNCTLVFAEPPEGKVHLEGGVFWVHSSDMLYVRRYYQNNNPRDGLMLPYYVYTEASRTPLLAGDRVSGAIEGVTITRINGGVSESLDVAPGGERIEDIVGGWGVVPGTNGMLVGRAAMSYANPGWASAEMSIVGLGPDRKFTELKKFGDLNLNYGLLGANILSTSVLPEFGGASQRGAGEGRRIFQIVEQDRVSYYSVHPQPSQGMVASHDLTVTFGALEGSNMVVLLDNGTASLYGRYATFAIRPILVDAIAGLPGQRAYQNSISFTQGIAQYQLETIQVHIPVVNAEGHGELLPITVQGGRDTVNPQHQGYVLSVDLVASHDLSLIVPISGHNNAINSHYESSVNGVWVRDGSGFTHIPLTGTDAAWRHNPSVPSGPNYQYNLHSDYLIGISRYGLGFLMLGYFDVNVTPPPPLASYWNPDYFIAIYSRAGRVVRRVPIGLSNHNLDLSGDTGAYYGGYTAQYAMNGAMLHIRTISYIDGAWDNVSAWVWLKLRFDEYIIDAVTGEDIAHPPTMEITFPYTAFGHTIGVDEYVQYPSRTGTNSFGPLDVAYMDPPGWDGSELPLGATVVGMRFVDRPQHQSIGVAPPVGDVESVIESAGLFVMRESDLVVALYALDASVAPIARFEGAMSVTLGQTTARTAAVRIDGVWSLWDIRDGRPTKFHEDARIVEVSSSAGLTEGSEVIYLARSPQEPLAPGEPYVEPPQVPHHRSFLEVAPYGSLSTGCPTEFPPGNLGGTAFSEEGWIGQYVKSF